MVLRGECGALCLLPLCEPVTAGGCAGYCCLKPGHLVMLFDDRACAVSVEGLFKGTEKSVNVQ